MKKKKNKKGLSICFFSDTHGKHHEMALPEADIAICCGDISSIGYKWQIKDFLDWFSAQPHKYKLMIAGNHDFWFEPEHPRNTTLNLDENPRDIIPEGIIYLEDETIEIEGIKIFGSPWTPWFHNWAFNAHRGEECKKHWDLIEPGTDIIITHGPPANVDYLDRCMDGQKVGCADLIKKIIEIQPTISVSGHIHEGYGHITKEIMAEDGVTVEKVTTFINCSVLNFRYEMTNDPVVVELDENKEITSIQ